MNQSLNPEILLLGWLFAKNSFLPQYSNSEQPGPGLLSQFLVTTDSEKIKTSDNLYLIVRQL